MEQLQLPRPVGPFVSDGCDLRSSSCSSPALRPHAREMLQALVSSLVTCIASSGAPDYVIRKRDDKGGAYKSHLLQLLM